MASIWDKGITPSSRKLAQQQRYDAAFEEGNAAYHAGAKRDSNPHLADIPTAEGSGWAAGWDWGKAHD